MADLLGLLRSKKLLDDEDFKKAREWLRHRGLPQDDLLPALMALGLVAPHDIRANLEELAETESDDRSGADEEDLYLLGQLVRQRLITLDRLTRCLDHKRALEGSNRTVRIHEIMIEDGAITVGELAKILQPLGRELLDCHHCGNLEIVRPLDGRAACPRCGSDRDLEVEAAQRQSTRRNRRSDMHLQTIEEPESDPERIGPYQVLELLGKGAAGVVYRGYDPDTGNEVAIKFLATSLGVGPRTRFHREARILAALDHPGIVRVHGLGQEGHAAFLILDYIAGRTLDKWVSDEQPNVESRLAIFRQVAEAMAYAHARGILHRDIKPSNILVDNQGIAKLTDFGLAKRVGLDGVGSVTDTGEILGTPRFMSPEQVRGEEASEASDQYALGVVLFELLSGRPLYQGVSMGELFAQIEKTLPQPPSRGKHPVPEALDLICLKALEKKIEDRFPSVIAMVEEINRYQLGKQIRLALTTRRTPQPPLKQRHPVLFYLLLAGGLLLGTILTALGYGAYLEIQFLKREKVLKEQLLKMRR